MAYHARLLEQLEKLEFKTLLEVGCGFDFPNLRSLRNKNKELSLTGIDNYLIGRNMEVPENVWIGNFDLVKGLPFPDKSFDVVLSAATLSCMPHVLDAIQEIKRLAKKYIVLVEFQGQERNYSTGDSGCVRIMRNYEKLFDLGFEILDIPKDIWPGNGWDGDAPGKIMICSLKS